MTSDPAPGSPAAGGPMHGGPMTGDPASGGPMTGDPMTGDPAPGGPMTGGPMTGDPVPGSPEPEGPEPGGPTPGGPTPGGTAVLSSQPGMAPPPPAKLNRKQRKAAKKAEKRAGGGRQPVMPIDGRQRPTKTLAAVLIIGGLLVSGVLLMTLFSPDTSTGDVGFDFGGGSAPEIVSATSFDPLGDDGEEFENLAGNAIDNDEATQWQTARYARAGLGGLKPGVGLILIAEESGSFGDMTLITANEGWSAEIYVADEFGPNDTSFDPASLGEPAATVTDGGNSETVSLDGASGSQVMVWVTETGVSINTDGDETFRFVLFEAIL